MPVDKEAVLRYHCGGKVGLRLTKRLDGVDDLCLAYTPGVAVAVKEIHKKPSSIYNYTAKGNLVAVVTDGTAILGLGDLGAEASIPVMEGKAVLFKAFGDVDGWPVPLNHCRVGGKNAGPTDPQRVIDAVCAMAPMYGGINLEDIAAPACFEIEDTLDRILDIPVFHDDQWGTAVITLAGVTNYCKLAAIKPADLKVVVNGAGAAGIRITELLKAAGVKNLILCDSKGVVSLGRKDLNSKKAEHAVESKLKTVGEALHGANVFVGVSAANCIDVEDVVKMAPYPAIFAMANPDPEIRPEIVAKAMGRSPYVMATGRSDYANQINNVLGFPFLFRGALDVGARTINMQMKLAAAAALAAVAREPVTEEVRKVYPREKLEFGSRYIIPKPFDSRLFVTVSYAVAEAAVKSKVAHKSALTGYMKKLEKHNKMRWRPGKQG